MILLQNTNFGTLLNRKVCTLIPVTDCWKCGGGRKEEDGKLDWDVSREQGDLRTQVSIMFKFLGMELINASQLQHNHACHRIFMEKRNSLFRTAIQLLRALRKLLPLNRTLPHEESTDITQQPELQLPCKNYSQYHPAFASKVN